jgi:predicted transcriptional regulator
MKRNRQQIFSEILEICREGANKTKIVYNANLNFKSATSYLQALIKNNLIEVNQGVYQTTLKGESLLEIINQVNEQLYGQRENDAVHFSILDDQGTEVSLAGE